MQTIGYYNKHNFFLQRKYFSVVQYTKIDILKICTFAIKNSTGIFKNLKRCINSQATFMKYFEAYL